MSSFYPPRSYIRAPRTGIPSHSDSSYFSLKTGWIISIKRTLGHPNIISLMTIHKSTSVATDTVFLHSQKRTSSTKQGVREIQLINHLPCGKQLTWICPTYENLSGIHIYIIWQLDTLCYYETQNFLYWHPYVCLILIVTTTAAQLVLPLYCMSGLIKILHTEYGCHFCLDSPKIG
jgi:hypothetical protein